MTFKRHVDRLPIIPADATVHNAVCQFCIVGCGYHAYSWPINQQGGAAPNANVFGVDLAKQQASDDAELVFPIDVQHREAGRERRPSRHQAGP